MSALSTRLTRLPYRPTTSQHRLTTAMHSSHSPSMVVNIESVRLGRPDSRTTRMASATAAETDPEPSTPPASPAPVGATENAISMPKRYPGAATGKRHIAPARVAGSRIVPTMRATARGTARPATSSTRGSRMNAPVTDPTTTPAPGRVARAGSFVGAQVRQAGRTPVTLAVVALIWVLGAVTGSLLNGPSADNTVSGIDDADLVATVGAGVQNLTNGHVWTFVTSAFFAS